MLKLNLLGNITSITLISFREYWAITNFEKRINKNFFRSINVVGQGIGIGHVGGICYTAATGASYDLKDVQSTALTVAHELGHNLGKKRCKSEPLIFEKC